MKLADLAPIKVDRLEIIDGEVLIGVGKGKKAPQLWVNKMHLVAENMATRKALMEGEPSTMRLKARVQKSGKLTASASMDPWAPKLTFKSKALPAGTVVGKRLSWKVLVDGKVRKSFTQGPSAIRTLKFTSPDRSGSHKVKVFRNGRALKTFFYRA